MKVNILQQDLFPALSAVARSCGVRSQLPVLGNVLLQTDQGRLKLSATNLEIGVVKFIKAEIEEEGEITVPAKTLVEVVANLGGEKLEITSSSDQLEITTPTFSSKVSGIAASEFPIIPLAGKEATHLDPQILIKALPEVTFSSAVDEGRPVLTGILTEIKDGHLELVATDGYRLAHKIVPTKAGVAFKALVPRRTLEEIARLMSEEEVDGLEITTSNDQNQIIFSFGNTRLSSRLIDGQFPAWEKIIPTDYQARLVVERLELLKAVKLASIFAKGEANIVKLQNSPQKLILTSEAKELGNQKKEIKAEGEGQEIQIAFNTKFLIDALSATSSSQVILELSGPLSAAILKPMGEDGLRYVIMPVNLS
ncbi:DNA polymerase III subunit beta [Candidatus Daviesbacteria bacterium]|nr:DNA polymerase III subunit beta [Candidatus Daviesbacteria bacterium]